MGISAEQIEALAGDYEASPLLSERDKAVVRWAESMTLNQAPHDDEAFERLKRFFTSAEIMELTWVIGLFNMNNRVQDALRLEIEEQHEVDRIRRSRVLTEEMVVEYARKVVELYDRRKAREAGQGGTAQQPSATG